MKIILIIFFISVSGVVNAQSGSSYKKGYLGNSIFVDGVYTRNTSDFSSTFNYSQGGYVGYSIFLAPTNTLVFRSGYMSQNLKEGEQGFTGSSMDMIPIHFGGRYYFMNSRVMPFISFMNGANIINQKINNLDSNSYTDNTIVRYVWQVGTGLTFGITKNVTFEIDANYNSSFYQHEAMLTGFEYSAGFGYVFK